MKVLVINAGSSSIKYHLYQMPQVEILAKGEVGRIGEENSELSHFFNGKTHTVQTKVEDVGKAMELILETLVSRDAGIIQDFSEIGAVGHRVVHGGEEFTGSVIIDEKVIASVKKFADLAPLHNPPNLAGIQAVQRKLPDAKQVACFDTPFMPPFRKSPICMVCPRSFMKNTAFAGTTSTEFQTDTLPVVLRP